ncbi:uncharacterized protein LOC143279549 [Babylonia areolata]|uniref:uncharacterized protein LOC143279549 n=1 Tax=Babylonia areolata TaxID=304850 RepID=UPI003FD64C47
MPGMATGLPFYRKRQSLDSLAGERPQSLQSVYAIVRNNVAHVLEHVTMMEHSFYGPEGSLETEVRRWMPIINQVIRPAKYSDLINMAQLDAINDRLQDPTDRLKFDLDLMQQLYDLVDKVKNAVQQGLAEDILLLERLREFMHKYCQSFSPTEGEAYLETATNYEKQKRELERAVSINLKNVPLMVEMFEKEVLKIQQFDFVMREAGEKAGCAQAALLLVFPAACHHIRNACKGLEMWMEADANYAHFIQLDIAELTERRNALVREVHQHALRAGEHEHRVKAIQRELATCSQELKRLGPKKKALEAEEADLREENHDVLVDLDIKEYRRHEMKVKGAEASDNFHKLSHEIDTLRKRKPAIDRKLADLHKKQGFVSDKQSRRRQLEEEMETARGDLRAARKATRKAEVEVERAEACLDKLREIHRLKVAPDTLKKIFHGMPASPKHAPLAAPPGKRNKKDKLEVVCHQVAQSIDADWKRLYHTLPFHPPRGQHIIADDIDDISTRFLRHTTEEQARQSLAKWRRLHTRACVEDVRTALQGVKRPDVLERIDVKLTTPRARPCVGPKRHRTVHFPQLPTGRTR